MRCGNIGHVYCGREEVDANQAFVEAGLGLTWTCNEKTKENFPNPTKEEGHEDQAWSEGYSEHIQLALAWGLWLDTLRCTPRPSGLSSLYFWPVQPVVDLYRETDLKQCGQSVIWPHGVWGNTCQHAGQVSDLLSRDRWLFICPSGLQDHIFIDTVTFELLGHWDICCSI